MTADDMFNKIKERAFFMFSFNRISIDPAFFSRFDDEFKNHENFQVFMKAAGDDYIVSNQRLFDEMIQPMVELYFKFCKNKFEALSLDEQVDLAADEILKHISFYRGSKLHGVLDKVRNETIMSMNIDTLFNGDYFADAVYLIGHHFQTPVTLKEIKPKLKKEITRLRESKKEYIMIREQHCFRYMLVMDSIFKVKTLRTELNQLKIKHGISELKKELE